jgi:hypothetical protein
MQRLMLLLEVVMLMLLLEVVMLMLLLEVVMLMPMLIVEDKTFPDLRNIAPECCMMQQASFFCRCCRCCRCCCCCISAAALLAGGRPTGNMRAPLL